MELWGTPQVFFVSSELSLLLTQSNPHPLSKTQRTLKMTLNVQQDQKNMTFKC